MSKISIVPNVKKYEDLAEKVLFDKLAIKGDLSDFHKEILFDFVDDNSLYFIEFKKDLSVSSGAYFINVYQEKIECLYFDNEGLHNSVCTLRQLLLNINKLTTCRIYDEPFFKVRSVMIDISRNKVPKLETLKNIAYTLSLLKINDLQLYMEGRSFYYSFLDEFYEDKNDFLLPEELKEFNKYCNEIGITLTPNTNCFGHMAFWLNQEKLKHLAFKPEGFEFSKNGTRGYAQTINPDSEEAYNFIIKQFDELLDCFPNCRRMTIGGDEPFELLFPTKNPNAKEIYIKHMSKIIDYVKSRNIVPCMWGDVVKEYPETLDIFKDVVLLEWGYDVNHLNERNCSIYKENNIPFMVCPGTSGWLTFSGRMENMIGNYSDAVTVGKTCGATGMVITDWNDGGSYSQVTTNILTYAYGACYAWCGNDIKKEELNEYLDIYVYKVKIAEKVYHLGNYYLCQKNTLCNMTKLYISFFSCQTDGINIDIKSYSDCNALSNNKNVLDYDEIDKTRNYLVDWINDFKNLEDNNYVRELMFTYKMIKHSLNLNYVYLQLMNVKECRNEVEFLLNDIRKLKVEYNDIWHYRNKKSDYKYSIKRLEMLEWKYKQLLILLNNNF